MCLVAVRRIGVDDCLWDNSICLGITAMGA